MKGFDTMGAETDRPPLFGQRGGQHALGGFINHDETYGPHVIARFLGTLQSVRTIVDLGAGTGRDLLTAKRLHPDAKTVAIEGGQEYARGLVGKVDDVHVLNIEHDPLPFADASIDVFMANQVLEHTKEIFWIFHEITRSLKVGGHFLIGVPNVASFHNRMLLMFGRHPTQHKLCSAHVRPFSRADTLKFTDACFPGGYSLAAFAGSQFYPFPKSVARALAAWFPTAAFSIFFLLRKERPYGADFATYPARARLETNFWSGNVQTSSQY